MAPGIDRDFASTTRNHNATRQTTRCGTYVPPFGDWFHTLKATWGELLFTTSPALRSTLILGLGLGIAQQASGSEAAVYYSPSVLDDAG